MSAVLRFTLDDADLRARLAAAQENATDLRPGLRGVGRAGVGQTRRRFLNGRDPEGRPWKKGRKKTGQTLIASGLLLRSIHSPEPEPNAVEWGSNRIYAGVHQDGATIRPRTAKALRFRVEGRWVSVQKVDIPKRAYLGVNPENAAEFTEIMLGHVGGPLTGEAAP